MNAAILLPPLSPQPALTPKKSSNSSTVIILAVVASAVSAAGLVGVAAFIIKRKRNGGGSYYKGTQTNQNGPSHASTPYTEIEMSSTNNYQPLHATGRRQQKKN